MAHSTSHTVDLGRIQQFIAGAAPRPTVQLKRRVFLGALALALLGSGGAALYKSQARPAPAMAAPAVPVTALTLRPQAVSPWAEFSGRIKAVDYAEIRPEVGGRITEIRFKDGQQVKKGDVLFVIDPRPYQAAVERARGDLASAENNARLARIQLDRGARLIKEQALAQEAYDQRANADGVAQANVASARAALSRAALDVDRAYVKAPISGRVSRAELTLGNLVQTAPAAPPLLTSIASDNGVYADFEVDEQTYLNSVRGKARNADQEHAPGWKTICGCWSSWRAIRYASAPWVTWSRRSRNSPNISTVSARTRCSWAYAVAISGAAMSRNRSKIRSSWPG